MIRNFFAKIIFICIVWIAGVIYEGKLNKKAEEKLW